MQGLYKHCNRLFSLWIILGCGLMALPAFAKYKQFILGDDSHLNSANSGVNYGSTQWLYVGKIGTGANADRGPYRPAIKFPIDDSLPSNAIIDSADIYLYMIAQNGAADNIAVYVILQSWLEGSADGTAQDGSVTWNSRQHNVSTWNSGGASTTGTDRNAAAEASVSVGTINSWYTWRVTSAVQDWVDGTQANNGLLFIGTENSNLRKQFNSLESGNAELPYFDVWYRVYPVITGLSGAASASASQDDSSYVSVYYEVGDNDDSWVVVTMEYQVGGAGGWTALTNTTGDIDTVDANSQNADRTVLWDAKTQLGSSIDDTYAIRIVASDSEGNADTVVTSSFLIDTEDPTTLANLAVVDSGVASADLQWTAAVESHFSHYEIWYGTDKDAVNDRSVSAFRWSTDEDATMSTISTTSATVLLLEYLTKYYFKMWALDSAGNEYASNIDSMTTLTTTAPLVTGWDPSSKPNVLQYNTDSAYVGYEIWDADDSTLQVEFEMRWKDEASWRNWTTMSAYVNGDTGYVAVDIVKDQTIYWDVRGQFGSIDSTAFVRIIVTDSANNKDTATSVEFIIDTEAPTFSPTLSSPSKTASTVDLQWSATASDTHFNHYEIWYGTSQANVQSRSNAAEWDEDNDAALTTASTTSTSIYGLLANTTYYFKIWAVDDYGNETTVVDINVTTDATATTQLTDVSDNMMEDDNPNFNYGGDATHGGATAGKVGSGGGGYLQRTLVKINNISDVPAGATIVSATFNAYAATVGSTNGYNIGMYRVLRDWNEGTATGVDQANQSNWNDYADENNWTTAGASSTGNDITTVITSTTVSTVGWYSWDITADFAAWHNGTNPNYGMLFMSASEGTNDSYKNFNSAEGANVPYVDVTYVMEPPQVSGLSDTTLITAYQNNADTAIVKYELSDPNDLTATVSLQYKLSGGSWTSTSNTSGDIGAGIPADNEFADRTIYWDVRTNLGIGVDGTYKLRVIANDGTLADTTESNWIGLDTKDPLGLANFVVADSFSYSMDFNWTAVTTEGHFSHYEIWYGSNKTDVSNRSGTAQEWDGDNNNGMNTASTNTMIITGLSSSTKYYFKIWVVDSMTNEATTGMDSATTLDDPIPTVTGWSQASVVNASQINPDTVQVGYQVVDIDDSLAVCGLQYTATSPISWANATTVTGDVDTVVTGVSYNDTIYWNALTDLGAGIDASYYVRVHCVDDTSFADTTQSASFSIDFVSPVGLASLTAGTTDATSSGLSWTSVSTESHFSHYEIWYGTNQSDVQNRTGTALEWTVTEDATLAAQATDTTTVTSLVPNSTYYFKIWAVDSAGNETTVADVNVATSATNDPVVTGPSNAPKIAATQYSTSDVRIRYEVDDADDASVTVSAEYFLYAGSGWTSLTNTSGDIGSVTTSPTNQDTIIWTAATQLGSIDSVYQIRVIATDGGVLDTLASDTFAIDTKAPSGLASFSATDTTGVSISLGWTAATDRNFSNYEIWYGTNQTDVQNRTGTATEWDGADDGNLNSATTSATTITSLSIGTSYYFKIWALDNIGNESTLADINVSTKSQVAANWSKTSIGEVKGGAVGLSRLYVTVGSPNFRLISYNLSTGAQSWFFSTVAYGAANRPSYIYSGGVYKILLSAGNFLIGRQDNVTSSSALFTTIDFGTTVGVPYASPDDSTFYVTYTNAITRRMISGGSVVSGWPQTLSNVSTNADPVVENDAIYVATTSGMVYSYDVDGTQGPSFNAGANVSQPMVAGDGILYIAPNSANLYAVNASTMSAVWTPSAVSLDASNTGAPYVDKDLAAIYVAVGNKVQKINNNGATASVEWTFDAGDNISSSPVVKNGVVYFGRDNGRYYAINDAATPTAVTNWPYADISGDADMGPWIDVTNNQVIFGTSGQNLDAFNLE